MARFGWLPVLLVLFWCRLESLAQIKLETDLPICQTEESPLHSAHIIFMLPVSPGENDTLSHLHLAGDVAVQLFHEISESDINLTTSMYNASLEDINTTISRALDENKEKNVVAVMGMYWQEETQMLRTATQGLPYLNLDISLSEQRTDSLVTREAHYSYLTASVLVNGLKSFNVTQCALIRSPNSGPSIEEFEQYAKPFGITAKVDVVVPLDDLEGLAIAAAVQEIKDKNIKYIITLLSFEDTVVLLAHAHDMGLSGPITWLTDTTFNLFSDTSLFNTMRSDFDARASFFSQQKLILDSDVRFQDVLQMAEGSLSLSTQTAYSPKGFKLLEAMKNTSGFDPIEEGFVSTLLPALYGDLFLAVGYAVNEMDSSGYGCHLRHDKLSMDSIMTLYEFLKRVEFLGFTTGTMEFTDSGDRIFHNFTINSCSKRHNSTAGVEYPDSPLPCARHKTYSSTTGELIETTENPIYWNDGSSTPPSPPPSDGVIIILEKAKKESNLFFIILLCGAGLFIIVFLIMYRVWRQNKSMKKLLKDEIERKVVHLNLDAPFTRTVKMLQQVAEGKSVSRADAIQLSIEMLNTKDLMKPDLQTVMANTEFNDNIQRFLVQATSRPAVNSLRQISSTTTNDESEYHKSDGESSGSSPTRGEIKMFDQDDEMRRLNSFRSSLETAASAAPSASKERNMYSDEINFFDSGVKQQPTLPYQLLENMKLGESFSFNIMEIPDVCNQAPLLNCALHLMNKHDLLIKLNLEEKKLVAFLSKVEAGYDSGNPYHNNAHAADVMQRLITMLTAGERAIYPTFLSDLEFLSCIVAAVIHDYNHPGKNNAFLINTADHLAETHNDKHVLENHSLSACLRLLNHPQTSFTERLSIQDRKTLRAAVINMVLATDMAEHFRVLNHFGQKLSPEEIRESHPLSDDKKQILMEMAIKVADLGHTTLPQAAHVTWVEGLQEEFFRQGDEEKVRKFQISPLCNRRKFRNGPASGENQMGFFEVICKPMYSSWIERFPVCMPLEEQLTANFDFWTEESKNKTDPNAHANKSEVKKIEKVVPENEICISVE